MAHKQPTDTDKIISHAAVGMDEGVISMKKGGLPGLIGGAGVGVIVHAMLNAVLPTLSLKSATRGSR